MADADSSKEKREVVYRHSGAVRVTHWVNVVALLVLLMSGCKSSMPTLPSISDRNRISTIR